MALIKQLADRDPEQPVPAELKRTTEDLAWFIADNFAPLTRNGKERSRRHRTGPHAEAEWQGQAATANQVTSGRSMSIGKGRSTLTLPRKTPVGA
jgi:hypothetical protein